MDAAKIRGYCQSYFSIEKPKSKSEGLALGLKIASYITVIIPVIAAISLGISTWYLNRKITVVDPKLNEKAEVIQQQAKDKGVIPPEENNGSGAGSKESGTNSAQDASSSTNTTGSGSAVQEEETKYDNSELDALIASAEKDNDAYLIDFSKINPSNIFKILNKSFHSRIYGDVRITDTIGYDESDKFTQNFSFKYRIEVVAKEKNEHGHLNSSGYMFTMSDEGRVESYGQVYDNFDAYIEDRMKRIYYQGREHLQFTHVDFESVQTSNGNLKLRKQMNKPASNVKDEKEESASGTGSEEGGTKSTQDASASTNTASSSSTAETAAGSASNSVQHPLNDLIKFAPYVEEKTVIVSLIDFKKINSLNIMQVFNKNASLQRFGDVLITDDFREDSRAAFKLNYPLLFKIHTEKNGYGTNVGDLFRINEEGSVETFEGKNFHNFDEYIHDMMTSQYSGVEKCGFQYFDFDTGKTVRPSASGPEFKLVLRRPPTIF